MEPLDILLRCRDADLPAVVHDEIIRSRMLRALANGDERPRLAQTLARLSGTPGTLDWTSLVLFADCFYEKNTKWVTRMLNMAFTGDVSLFSDACRLYEEGPQQLEAVLTREGAAGLSVVLHTLPVYCLGESKLAATLLSRGGERLKRFMHTLSSLYDSLAAVHESESDAVAFLKSKWLVLYVSLFYLKRGAAVLPLADLVYPSLLLRRDLETCYAVSSFLKSEYNVSHTDYEGIDVPSSALGDFGRLYDLVRAAGAQTDLAAQVESLMDLFPDQEPAFLRVCLERAREGEGDARAPLERVTEWILTGLPPDLERIKSDAARNKSRIEDAFTGIDTENMVQSKKKVELPSLIGDDLKSIIIQRAEAISSDEENSNDEAFLSDGEDKAAVRGRRDDVDENDVDVDDVKTLTPSFANPYTKEINLRLQSEYLKGTKVFERASKKSKERLALRQETGLDDHQIESWFIMFERNPKKEKLLQLHDPVRSFTGNENAPLEKEPHRVNGHEKKNTGGKKKKSDGGRAAHDRRQRGNDKKMAMH